MSGFFAEDDPQVLDPETDLLTAEASAVDGFPTGDDPSEQEPVPIGRTWLWDWNTNSFHLTGISPSELTDAASLGMWVETVLRIGRFAYGIFSDEYGLEDPDRPIGELVTADVLADLARRITEALMAHDRIQAVENIALTMEDDAIVLRNMEIVYDESNRIAITDVKVP